MTLRELWQLVLDFFNKEDTVEIKPLISDFQDKPSAKSPAESARALFRRLDRDSKQQPYVRRLYAKARQESVLVDEIISLMFLVERTQDTYTEDRLIAALNRKQSLNLHWNAFYIYVEKNFPLEIERGITQSFYDRLAGLSRDVRAVQDFVNERRRYKQRIAGATEEPFEPENPVHRRTMKNFLPCYFSFCRKEFERSMEDQAFIVGRKPLHDRDEINRYERERADDNEQRKQYGSALGDDAATALLAATVTALGRYKGKRVNLNAHRFDSIDDGSPQPEGVIYAGNWLKDWEISIGAAEHDEVRCEPLEDKAAKALISNLMLANKQRWTYNFRPPEGLPDWFKCYDKKTEDERDEAADSVSVYFLMHGGLDQPLLDFIGRRQFRQEIKLVARALPVLEGQLSEMNEISERSFRAALEGLVLAAAIEVRPEFWLVRTEAGEVLRLIRRDGAWERTALANSIKFNVGNFTYMWNGAGDFDLPQYAGLLYIYPPDKEVKDFNRSLNADVNADGLLIAYEQPFASRVNPDRTLGSKGVVSVKCINVKDDGRGNYGLMPAKGAKNKFFAFQPVGGQNIQRPASKKSWLIYDGKGNNGDLTLDQESGFAYYNGKVIIADQYGYNLVCGTSFFQLKVSGTPYVGEGGGFGRRLALPAAPTAPAGESEAVEFDPTPSNIAMRLLDTEWADYQGIRQVDQSNFAVHCILSNESGDEKFIKAYYANSAPSAKRESSFYEKYQGRAAELFIPPPDEMLRLPAEDTPWGIIFPRLTPIDEVFPEHAQPTLAQVTAIGYALARLLHAMSDDGLINFDIDRSTLCFGKNGRLVIVDFDNVYPILSNPAQPDELAVVRGILGEGKLPAKNPSLPSEARDFIATTGSYKRQEALAKIGAPFSMYMLAVVMLQLKKSVGASMPTDSDVTIPHGALTKSASEENTDAEAAGELEKLLRAMLNAKPADRPKPAEVVVKLGGIAHKFVRHSPKEAEDISRLIGDTYMRE